ncbi:MAG TPA: hypothetical protein VIQ29_04440 [Ancylobacter sp.]
MARSRDLRPALRKVFVVTASGVWPASLISEADARSSGKARVRVRGATSVTLMDARLIFDTREAAAELRGRAVALSRSREWRHRSVTKATSHLIESVRPS